MRIGPARPSSALVRQSPLVHGRFSFQDEAAGSSPARPTKPAPDQWKRWSLRFEMPVTSNASRLGMARARPPSGGLGTAHCRPACGVAGWPGAPRPVGSVRRRPRRDRPAAPKPSRPPATDPGRTVPPAATARPGPRAGHSGRFRMQGGAVLGRPRRFVILLAAAAAAVAVVRHGRGPARGPRCRVGSSSTIPSRTTTYGLAALLIVAGLVLVGRRLLTAGREGDLRRFTGMRRWDAR
jgi:hypothetical protein